MAHKLGGARGSAGEVGEHWQEKDRAAIDSAKEVFYFTGWERGAGAWDAGATSVGAAGNEDSSKYGQRGNLTNLKLAGRALRSE